MAAPINLTANLNLNPASVQASAKQVQQALGRITGQASEFQKSLDASTARVFAFGATTSVINGINQAFKKLVSTTINVQSKLTEIQTILGGTQSEFNKFRTSIFNVAKSTGQSFDTVAEGAAELARQGLNAAETSKRLEAALILTRISGLDAASSVKALTAAMNGFTSAGLTAESIVNKIVAVDTAFAVSAQDLADGFSRAGSTAEDAGVSFDELLGLITAVEQKTARGGSVIGNAFKSIFSRLSRSTTIEDLKNLGVQIDASQSGVQKLQALSKALEQTSDPTISNQIKELAGGVYQINVVSAALKDLSSESSIFANASKTAMTATNEAYGKNAKLNETIASQLNSLIASVTSFSEKIGTVTFGPLLENLLKISTNLSEGLDAALDPEKGSKFIKGLFSVIGNFISGPGLVLITSAFVKIFQMVAKFAAQGFQEVMKIGSESERIKNIESGIVDLLGRDVNLRKILASKTATQAQKEQAIIAAIKQENQLLLQQQQILNNIAQVAIRAGVTSYGGSSQGFGGKGGQKFATGFQQEEAMAMMLGASSNVKAHYGQGTIGGKSFIMNSQEIEIPNFGSNGDSAVIPMYAKGYAAGYDIRDIQKKRLSDLLKINTGADKFKKSSSEAQSAYYSRLKQLQAEQKQKEQQRINLDASQYAFLVPKINYSENIPNVSGVLEKGKKRIPFNLSNLEIQGPKISSGSQKMIGDNDDKLGNNIRRSIYTSAAKFASTLSPIGAKIGAGQVAKKMKDLGGAKGAIQSAIGAAFEGAVATSLNISPAKSFEGGDFDVKGQSQEINDKVKQLFGLRNKQYKAMDFKVSSRRGSQISFAKKIYNEKFKAAGHIPKFAKGSIPSGRGESNFGRFLAIQSLLYSAQGLSDVLTDGKEEFKDLNTTISGVIQALSTFEALNMVAGGKLGTLIKKIPVVGATGSLLTRGASLVGGAVASGAGALSSGAGAGATLSGSLGAGAAVGAGGLLLGGAIAGGGAGYLAGSYLADLDRKQSEKQQADQLKRQQQRQSIGLSWEGLGGQDIEAVSKKAQELGLDIGTLSTTYKRAVNVFYMSEASEKTKQNAVNAATEALKKLKASIAEETAKRYEITSELTKLKGAVKGAIQKNIADAKNYGQFLDKTQVVQGSLSTMLGAVQGPAAASLQAQNEIQSQITSVAQSDRSLMEMRNALTTATGDAAKDLQEKINEASIEFKQKIVDAATAMAKRRMDVENRLNDIATQRSQEQASILSNSFNNIVSSVQQGPIDLTVINELRDALKNAKTPQEKANILAQANTEISKAPESIRNSLIKMLGLTQDQISQIDKSTMFEGGTKSQQDALYDEIVKDRNANLEALNAEEQALKKELTDLNEKIKQFGKNFNAEGVVNGLNAMAKLLENAGTDMSAFTTASTEIGKMGANVLEMAKKTNESITNTNKIIESNSKAIKDLESKVAKLTGP